MPWIITGSCNHCGLCCKPPVIIENPCIELGQDRCLFYADETDPEISKFGHCLIMQANRNYNRVRDRFGNKMNQEQIDWFEHNCVMWPTRVKDIQALIDELFDLPPECNFELTWVE